MALDLALVIRGDATGAIGALKQTATEAKALGGAATVSARDFSKALEATGGNLSRITPAMVGIAPAAASVAAATGSAAGAVKLSNAQLINMQYQMNDIATGLVSGQAPFVLMAQQGLQIAQVFGPGAGVGGALKAAGAGLLSFVANPLTLAVLGMGAAAQAASFLWEQFSGPGASKAEEALKRHKEWIDRIGAAFPEAGAAAKAYEDQAALIGRNQGLVETSNQLKAVKDGYAALAAEIERIKRINAAGQDLKILPSGAVSYQTGLLSSGVGAEIKAVIDDFQQGNKTAGELVETLSALKLNSNLSPELADVVSQLLAVAGNAKLAEGNINGVSSSLLALSGNQQTLRNFMQGTTDTLQIDKLNKAYQTQISAIYALSPAQKGAIAYQEKINALSGTAISYTEMLTQAENARSLAVAEAQHSLDTAEQSRLRSASQTVAAAETDLETTGLSIAKTKELTFVRQQLATAEAAAAQSGVTVSAAYIAKINELGAAYGVLQEKIALTQLTNQAAFDQSQIFRTDTEQGVASALYGVYGSDYQSHMDGAVAGQLRLNAALKTTTALTQNFGQIIVSGFMQGKSAADTLSGAFGNIASQLIQMAANQAITSLLGALFGSISSVGFGTARSTVAGFGAYGSFDTGGYTGNLPTRVAAGVVHGQEFVVNARATARHRPLLEAINADVPGFASGGFVGSGPSSVNHGANSDQISVSYAPTYHFAAGTSRADMQAVTDRDRRSFERELPGMIAEGRRRGRGL